MWSCSASPPPAELAHITAHHFGNAADNPLISTHLELSQPSTAAGMLATVRKQLRSHPALIPLFVFIGGGAAMSMMYLGRLALRNPDVCWDRKNNPEPWNKMSPTDQYKFFTVNMDYSKLKKQGPDF